MIDVAISYKQSSTPKGVLKHASKKARRRHDRHVTRNHDALTRDIIAEEIENDPLLNRPLFSRWDDPAPVCVAAAVFVWHNGIESDIPGYDAHSYHHSLKDAQETACYLEQAGVDPKRILISEHVWVEPWEVDRIPPLG